MFDPHFASGSAAIAIPAAIVLLVAGRPAAACAILAAQAIVFYMDR
jgi:hypothetical protein